jgi:hypothetical protein
VLTRVQAVFDLPELMRPLRRAAGPFSVFRADGFGSGVDMQSLPRVYGHGYRQGSAPVPVLPPEDTTEDGWDSLRVVPLGSRSAFKSATPTLKARRKVRACVGENICFCV